MRIQPLQQAPKSRSESAKGADSVRSSQSGIKRTCASQELERLQPLPQDWQEHDVDPKRDKVTLSEDAKQWRQGQWLTGGLKPGEDPKATAEEVIRNPEFAKQAHKAHKPRVSMRETAKQTTRGQSHESAAATHDGLPGPADVTSVDPKIAMAARHAPLESMLQRGPKTLNMRANLALPGGQNVPLTASFEMGEGNVVQAAFRALAS